MTTETETPRAAHNAHRVITLNLGLGRDSLTLLGLCFEGRLMIDGLGQVLPSDLDAVIFADTGAEWPHTYALIPRVRELCAEHGVDFVHLEKGTDWHTRPAIMDDLGSRSTVVSIGAGGDCTGNHKIGPIRKWISRRAAERFTDDGTGYGATNRSWAARVKAGTNQPHLTIVGIAADELSRLEHGGRVPVFVAEAYPLVEMGIAKADETPILARWDWAGVRKSGCYLCPFQSAGWFWALAELHPSIYADVVAYEAKSITKNARMTVTNVKVAGRLVAIPELVQRWRALNPDATTDAVLAKQYTRCVKDARAEKRAQSAAFDAPLSGLVRPKAAAPQLELFAAA